MCGIAGLVIGPRKQSVGSHASAMMAGLHHRGPDDHGWLAFDGCSSRVGQGTPDDAPVEAMLLHRRLSILDLSAAGRQPMSTADGRYHIVFNGEIYNYLELRRELEDRGSSFHTHTDTEVLLMALAEWGRAALPRLVGMFAFALLDARARRLLLVRDFFGIKPLFYTLADGCLAFASEIKALLEIPTISRRVNPQNLYTYLRFGVTDHSEQTMFAAIRQLPPAHLLDISLDAPELTEPLRYWEADPEPLAATEMSFDAAAQRLRELFLSSVELHLRSDVPIGTALSGGIDSSAIVTAARHCGGSALDFHSFSFIASDPQVSEEKWVDVVGRASAAPIHKVSITPGELRDDVDRLIDAQDEPFGSTSIYAQYRVFRRAQECGVKVLLDGQGADEMLAGYRNYLPARICSLLRSGRLLQAAALIQRAGQLPGVTRNELVLGSLGSLLPPNLQGVARRLVAADLVPRWLCWEWFCERGVSAAQPGEARAKRSLRAMLAETVSLTSLPMLLRYEDRNSMAFSIESRVPFLTPELYHFLLSLPEEYLLASDGTSKHVFRAAMRGIVPDAILDRKDKIGFVTPERAWLRELRPWVESVLSSDVARSLPVLRREVVKEEVNAVLAGQSSFDWRLWRWLNLIRWAELKNAVLD